MRIQKITGKRLKKWTVGIVVAMMLTLGATANAQSLDSIYFVGSINKETQEKLALASDSIFVVNVNRIGADNPRIIHYSVGTSILISEDELITNYHVIQEYVEMKATDKGTLHVASPAKLSKWIDADVVFTDEERDIAILKLHHKVDYKPITFAQAHDNQSVITIGYPANPAGQLILFDHLDASQHLLNTIARTRIYSSYEGFTGKEYMGSMQKEVAQGNSGGPVLDQEMNVVGMMTFVYDGRTYYLTADTLEIFIERYREANRETVKVH